MRKIGLIFDTETGNTNRVGVLISRAFPAGTVDVFSAAQLNAKLLANYSALILGTPSMDRGALADNWQLFVESDGLDFKGKTVALFGLGDQRNYPREFADGLFNLYQRVVELGATVVGFWPTTGYEYKASKADVGGQFVGLVIDQDNQPELTKTRIETWVKLVAPLLEAAA